MSVNPQPPGLPSDLLVRALQGDPPSDIELRTHQAGLKILIANLPQQDKIKPEIAELSSRLSSLQIEKPPLSALPLSYTAANQITRRTPLSTEEKENASGYVWECIEKMECSGEDTLYLYRLRDEFSTKFHPATEVEDRILTAIDEKFPAVEPTIAEFQYQDPTWHTLGFCVFEDGNDLYYLAPEPATLIRRWGKEHPSTPLHIKEVSDIVSDEEFIQGFLDHDLLIASDNHLIHDMFYHVTPTLSALMAAPTLFRQFQAKERAIVQQYLTWINEYLANLKEKGKPENELTLLKQSLLYAVGMYTDSSASRWQEQKTMPILPFPGISDGWLYLITAIKPYGLNPFQSNTTSNPHYQKLEESTRDWKELMFYMCPDEYS